MRKTRIVTILKKGIKNYSKPHIPNAKVTLKDMEDYFKENEELFKNREKIMTTPSEGSTKIVASWDKKYESKFTFDQIYELFPKILKTVETSEAISQLSKIENKPEEIYLKWREMQLVFAKEIQPLVAEFGFDLNNEKDQTVNLYSLKNNFRHLGRTLYGKEENKEKWEEYEKIRSSIYKNLCEKVFGIKVEEYHLTKEECLATESLALLNLARVSPSLVTGSHDFMALIQAKYKAELDAFEHVQNKKKEKKLGWETWLNYKVQLEQVLFQ